MVFVIGAVLLAASAFAQKYEVRTFTVPNTTTLPIPTDASGSTTDSTYQYLYNSVRQSWVCPLCSYSRATQNLNDDPAQPTTCPDPWGVHAGVSVKLQNLSTAPRSRFLALAAQTKKCTTSNPAVLEPKTDLMLPDAARDLFCYMLIGRPYKPTDSDGNTVRSQLYAAAAGLINATAADGPVIAEDGPVRFLVLPPTPLRRDVKATDARGTDYGLPQRRPSAQADLGNDKWKLKVVAPSNVTPLDTTIDQYLSIGVNPYRNDEGDVWWVRYEQTMTGTNVTSVTVYIYSVLYGWQGKLTAGGAIEPLPISAWDDDGDATDNKVGFPLSVVADSGAIKLTFTKAWSDTAGNGAWVVRFMVRSNCRLIPGWQDMADDDVDPSYNDIKNVDRTNTDTAKFKATDVSTWTFGGRKTPWMPAKANPVNVTTADKIAAPPPALPTKDPEGYDIPANTTGEGAVAVQWRDPDPALAAETAWTFYSDTDAGQVRHIYYRTGLEWQYDAAIYDDDADAATPDVVTDITNAEVAAGTANYNATHPYIHLAGARFMSTRTETPRTGTWWDNNADGTRDELAETQGLALAYPKIILGLRRDVGAAPDRLVYGAYGPGSTTARRTYNLLNRWQGGEATYTCTTCGAVFAPRWDATLPTPAYVATNPAECPYHPVPAVGTKPHVGEVNQRAGGSYDAAADVWREVTAFGPDERLAPAAAARHVLPASALKTNARTVAAYRNMDYANATDTSDMKAADGELWAEIPKQQPASVPGVGVTNDYANDLGYRGGLVLYRDEPRADSVNGLIGSVLTNGWDTFYRNPDNGYFQTSVGKWPYLCYGPDNTKNTDDDHIIFTPACTITGHTTATVDEVEGRHYYCTVCGAEYRDDPGTCPFDGGDAEQIAVTDAVRQEHLVAEEFEPFDVQVSVTRNAAGLAQSTSAIEIGRVAPGVRAQQPDTTARGVAANNYQLQDHRAFPGDVSPLPLLGHRPNDAKATLRNESNLALALRVGNVHDPITGTGAGSHGDYLRLGLDPWLMSWGRKAQSGPLTLDTLMPRVKDPAGTGGFEDDLLDRALWDVLAPGTEDIAGEDTWMPTGTTTRAPSSGLITAGAYIRRAPDKPVPFGQPVGLYSGRHPQYLDTLAPFGAFNFSHWNGSAFVATDTSLTEYNPATDLPMEPLVGMLEGQMRVVETRLPQSDYYSADNDPIVLPSPTPGVMQVIWSSNRLSADSSQPGYNAGSVGAGNYFSPLLTSRSPLNLIYVTTTGYTDPNDPLYRQYVWPAAGSGAIAPAAALTDQPDSTAGRITNSSPWAMYDLGGNKWSFWHRNQPNAGGVESTLRYNGPLAAANWNWNLAAEKFIYDTGQPKQGMRGFWGAGGAWLFWHEGNPGRERLTFRWNFDGTATSNEASVPVTNQAGSGITDLVNAPTLTNGTAPSVIRKAGTSPFTYTRDTSVFLSTPNGGPPTVNLFFSGFVTQEGQSDICWTKFNGNTMSNAGSGAMWANDNYSKLPFPRVTDEEMEPDGLRQLFGSRHLDWLVGRNPASDMPVVRAFLNGGGLSPAFRLQLGYRDTIGDGVARPTQSFDIGWDNTNDNTYDRARGIYRVTPVLYSVNGSVLPGRCGIVHGGGWYLRDPNSPAATPRPLTMAINPAAGTVQFSSPLFNEDAPTDRTATFWSSDTLGGGGNDPALEEVVLHVAYTPYVYRVTRSGAADDSPSAFWDPSTGGRLTIFWRRSYAASEAPHFGRPAYMYKCYTTSVQVGRPPVANNATITEWFSGNPVTVLASNPSSGIYTVDPATGQAYLRVEYNDGTADRVERHQVIGWSQEMVVPVDTVVGEGSMVAVPEAFDVPAAETGGATAPAVRYWLFWSSPRGVYDLRMIEDNGTRVAGDLPVHPSSDIYSAVVAPDFGSLAPERTVPTIGTNPT